MRVHIYLPEALEGRILTLSLEHKRHFKVLRLTPKDEIVVFDGKGNMFLASFTGKVRDKLTIGKRVAGRTQEPQHCITLATAVPQGSRMDVLTEKVSELGVCEIIPLAFKRSVVRPRESKLERLRRIAIEACAQSERAIVPIVRDLTPFAKLLDRLEEYDHVLVCHAQGTPMPSLHGSVLFIVGPEGDFTPEELALLEQYTKVRLANTILRVETAGITAVSQALLQFGEK